MDITFRFTTPTGQYEGAFFRDYFDADGYQRAKVAETAETADAILRGAYIGPDVDGVGVTWAIN